MEQEAASAADQYLREMETYYSNKEITDGIEERMAELLRERVGEDGVVSVSMINSVISILGRPERIAEDQPDASEPVRPQRKLYRDMENARVAGVCSGLGAYFKFDPIILRIAFAVLSVAGFFGFVDKSGVVSVAFPVIYLILWIAIPAARTAQQRWALRGDDGTAENIRRNVESGAGEVGAAIRQVGNSPAWGQVGRILEVIFGLILLVTAVAGLFAGALALLGWQWLGLGNILNDWMIEIMQEYPQASVIANTTWVKILTVAVYGLPFLGMLYGSIMMLFRIKTPSWHPGLVIFVVWIIALVALVVLLLACLFSASAITV